MVNKKCSKERHQAEPVASTGRVLLAVGKSGGHFSELESRWEGQGRIEEADGDGDNKQRGWKLLG